MTYKEYNPRLESVSNTSNINTDNRDYVQSVQVLVQEEILEPEEYIEQLRLLLQDEDIQDTTSTRSDN